MKRSLGSMNSFADESKTSSLNTNHNNNIIEDINNNAAKLKLNEGLKDITSLNIEKRLGAGTYGTVFKGIDINSGDIVALKLIKFMDKSVRGFNGFPVTTVREISILKSLKNENLVDLKGIVRAQSSSDVNKEKGKDVKYDAGSIFMIFEYTNYDLAGLINNHNVKFTYDHYRSYTKQLLNGVHYMHSKNILHRDIKAANILVTSNNIIKIADWGLARRIRPSQNSKDNKGKLTGPLIVTLHYRAPELLLECTHYSTEVDMWSVGCLIAELGIRTVLLKGTNETEQLNLIFKLLGHPPSGSDILTVYSTYPGWNKLDINDENRLSSILREKLKNVNTEMVDLIENILHLEPCSRMSAKDALNAEVFWSHKFGQVPDAKNLKSFSSSVGECHENDIKNQVEKQRREAQAMKHGGRGGQQRQLTEADREFEREQRRKRLESQDKPKFKIVKPNKKK